MLFIFSCTGFAQCYTAVKTYGTSQIALQTDGTLWAWGSNSFGLLGLGSNGGTFPLTQIGSSNDWSENYSVSGHAVAVKTDGTLWTWGRNIYGQCGNGVSGQQAMVTAPQQIGSETWLAVATGNSHSLAVKSDGTLWAWGNNIHNELGTVGTTMETIPVQVGSDQNWAKVYAALDYSFAIKTDGSLWSWGSGSYHRLGQTSGAETPHRVGTANDWAYVSPSAFNVFALKTDGTLWAWGGNYVQDIFEAFYGNGNPETDSNNYENGPIQIGTDSDWSVVCATQNNNFALKTDGTLWAWGKNQNGQLGDGTLVTKFSPVQLGTESDWGNLSSLVSLVFYALKENHSLYRWGSGTSVIVPTPYGSGCNLTVGDFKNFDIGTIAPNPVNQTLVISLNQPSKKTEVSIYTTVGQFVSNQIYPAVDSKISINFDGIAKGFYLIRIKNENGSYRAKIIKN